MHGKNQGVHSNSLEQHRLLHAKSPPEGPNSARTCTSCHIAICSCPLSSSRSITRYLCFTCCHTLTRTITCFTKPFTDRRYGTQYSIDIFESIMTSKNFCFIRQDERAFSLVNFYSKKLRKKMRKHG